MQKASQLKPSLCKIAIQKYPPFDEPLRPFCCPYCPPSLPPLSLPLISLRRHAKIENRKLVIRNWVYFFSRRSCLLANHPIQLFHIRNRSADQPFKLLPKIFKILNSFPNLPPKHKHKTPVSHAVLQSTPPLQFRNRSMRVS
jgi:hypothetical protein